MTKLFKDNTSKIIYDWLMNYNVSVNIFLKDHIGSWVIVRQKVWTDRLITIGRASAKTWRGPIISSETHFVVRHSWYYFQYSQCLINYPINIRQIFDECLLFWMIKISVHTWLEISCLSSVCQSCFTWNPEHLVHI
jgi:hypothetical protein